MDNANTPEKNAIDVANHILDLAKKNKDTVTPMQLIKLVYMCHGWMLGLYGRQLFNDDIEAWQYGPVIKSVYSQVKKYRDKAVTHHLPSNKNEIRFDEQETNVIEQVYKNYSGFSGVKLSALTHQAGSPWYKTWNSSGRNAVISNDLIEEYYSSLAK